jgi:hypothetical protein
LAKSVPSYLKDTTDFLRKLGTVGDLPDNCILVTADVESLYTNIPIQDGLQALERALRRREHPKPSSMCIKELAELVLRNNCFSFNGAHYTQISGTAMGTKMAPNYAILFMADFEETLLARTPLQPLAYCRYIDDIFFIWPHGQEHLEQFKTLANSLNANIRLQFETSRQSVAFLDVMVSLSETGTVTTDLYTKPTDTRQYLHFDSCHPDSHKLPIAFSQALRIRRICSDDSIAVERGRELKFDLVKRGYPRKKVAHKIAKALRISRQDLLTYRETELSEAAPETVAWVCTFHPTIGGVPDIFRKHWHHLAEKKLAFKVFWKAPVKLRAKLVSSVLHPVRPLQMRQIANYGTVKCNRARCKTCELINPSTTIVSHTTGLKYHANLHEEADCASAGLVYLIRFSCGELYVGETSQKLSGRIAGHRSDIRKGCLDRPVSAHFVEHQHEENDWTVSIIKIAVDEKRRFVAEKRWISQLMTDAPLGLNLEHVFNKEKHVSRNAAL